MRARERVSAGGKGEWREGKKRGRDGKDEGARKEGGGQEGGRKEGREKSKMNRKQEGSLRVRQKGKKKTSQKKRESRTPVGWPWELRLFTRNPWTSPRIYLGDSGAVDLSEWEKVACWFPIYLSLNRGIFFNHVDKQQTMTYL